MRAIRLILAARFRQQWRAWLLLTLLVGIGTGLVLSAVTAGRRADGAVPAFAAAHGYDAIVYAEQPLPLAKLPNVTDVTETRAPFTGQLQCSCGKQIDPAASAIFEVTPSALPRMVKLTSGRMPDQSKLETLVSFTMQRDYGIGPGTLIRVPLAGADQLKQIMQAIQSGQPPSGTLDGPVITLRVTGVVVTERELPAGNGASYDLFPTAAFATAAKSVPAFPFYHVRLAHGEADFAGFAAAVARTYGSGVQNLDTVATAVTAAVHPQAVAWWVVAGLTAVTFLLVTGQALARQGAADDADGPVLSAIGLRSGQFAAQAMLRTAVVAVTGMVAGIGVATALSPLTPAGEARLATPTPGLLFDWPVALAGGAAVVAAVLLLGLPPALRSARHAARRDAPVTRPSLVAAAAAAAGLPAAAVLGIRQALNRGRGASAAPVGAGLAGAVAAVTALSAIAVFGASLSHLLGTPELYGDAFSAYVNVNGTGAPPEQAVVTRLEKDPAIDRITEVTGPAVRIGSISAQAIALTVPEKPDKDYGPALLSASDGRLPARTDEVALGSDTLRKTGAHIGGTVPVTFTGPDGKPATVTLRVVGTLPFPADFGTGGIGDGAAVLDDTYLGVECPAALGAQRAAQCRAQSHQREDSVVMLHTVPGPAGDAALARLDGEAQNNLTFPSVPSSLASFGESANFPLIVAVVVAVAGVAALAHLLAVSVARRRRESALLKALGFVRPQLAAIVFWQTATVDLIAIAVGVPLGTILGRMIWRVFAGNLGVVPFTVYPGWLLAAIAGGFLLASFAIAALPARAAARARTGQVLRAE
jgi:FtsX-like permease family